MIQVLVVDDSKTAREAIAAILNTDPEIKVIGEAQNGIEAIAKVAALRPDVVTMDINMPVMNGYDATREIMALTPTPIVVVSSVSREELIHEGLDILLVGALEIVQKPRGISDANFELIASELAEKIKAVSRVKFPHAATLDERISLN